MIMVYRKEETTMVEGGVDAQWDDRESGVVLEVLEEDHDVVASFRDAIGFKRTTMLSTGK